MVKPRDKIGKTKPRLRTEERGELEEERGVEANCEVPYLIYRSEHTVAADSNPTMSEDEKNNNRENGSTSISSPITTESQG